MTNIAYTPKGNNGYALYDLDTGKGALYGVMGEYMYPIQYRGESVKQVSVISLLSQPRGGTEVLYYRRYNQRIWRVRQKLSSVYFALDGISDGTDKVFYRKIGKEKQYIIVYFNDKNLSERTNIVLSFKEVN